jgi:uncharacterized protein YuzE
VLEFGHANDVRPLADAAYVHLVDEMADGAAVENVVVEREGKGDIVLDFDSNGHLLGIEIIGAGDLVAAHVLAAATRH